MPVIDLNADLAEGDAIRRVGDDAAMLEVVTTANIACGGHAGDPTTMRQACADAARLGVAITAHVAYPDRDGFGRRFLDIDPGELTDHLIAQIGALQAIAGVEGARVAGVKPHGALYNAIAHHHAQAEAVVAALVQLNAAPTGAATAARDVADAAGDSSDTDSADTARSDTDAVTPAGEGRAVLALVAAPGAIVVEAARAAGVPVILEGFADRAYRIDGTLTPRREAGAVLTSPDAVRAQALQITQDQQVTTADGSVIPLQVQTLCLHGDTPGAVALARDVRSALEEAGVQISSALPTASAPSGAQLEATSSRGGVPDPVVRRHREAR